MDKIFMKIKALFSCIYQSNSRLKKANDRLDGIAFYNLIQNYRHLSQMEPNKINNKYEEIKEWIRKNYGRC